MLSYVFTPPGLYYLAGAIILISLVVYWQREPIKKEIRRWRGTEFGIGPFKFSRAETEKEQTKSGVSFGKGTAIKGGSTVKKIAGRDIRDSGSTAPGGVTPGVKFGDRTTIEDSDVSEVAGRDIEE